MSHNVFDDLTSATWGSGSRPFMLGDGPDKVAIDHNTIFSTNSQFIWLYGAPTTNSTYTNNMARHNLYGIMASGVVYGNDSINHSLPGLQQCDGERHRRRQRLEVPGRQLLPERGHMDGRLAEDRRRRLPPA